MHEYKLPPSLMIRDVHMSDRPRERLVRQGASSLSNQELIAILLRTGTKQESVLHLANRVLNYFEQIQELKNAIYRRNYVCKRNWTSKSCPITCGS